MSLTIDNFSLAANDLRQELEMPEGAEVLTAELFDDQIPEIRLFALVTLSKPPVKRAFKVIPAGAFSFYDLPENRRFIAKAGRFFVFDISGN